MKYSSKLLDPLRCATIRGRFKRHLHDISGYVDQASAPQKVLIIYLATHYQIQLPRWTRNPKASDMVHNPFGYAKNECYGLFLTLEKILEHQCPPKNAPDTEVKPSRLFTHTELDRMNGARYALILLALTVGARLFPRSKQEVNALWTTLSNFVCEQYLNAVRPESEPMKPDDEMSRENVDSQERHERTCQGIHSLPTFATD